MLIRPDHADHHRRTLTMADKKPATLISAVVELNPQSLTWGELRAIVTAAKDSDEAPVVFHYDETSDAWAGIYVALEV